MGLQSPISVTGSRNKEKTRHGVSAGAVINGQKKNEFAMHSTTCSFELSLTKSKRNATRSVTPFGCNRYSVASAVVDRSYLYATMAIFSSGKSIKFRRSAVVCVDGRLKFIGGAGGGRIAAECLGFYSPSSHPAACFLARPQESCGDSSLACR